MKIKKKDLRKREAQLPINYPAPEVEAEYTYIHIDAEHTRVEELCKRLAHNEVIVRDTVLAELPKYIKGVTQRLARVEANIDEKAIRRFIAMRDFGKMNKKKKNNKNDKKYNNNNNNNNNNEEEGNSENATINVLRELELFRSREEVNRREQRRQMALQRLQEQEEENNQNSFSINDDYSNNNNNNNNNYDDEEEEEEEEDDDDERELNASDMKNKNNSTTNGQKSLRQIYREWISVWCEVELLLLKLSRGIFFCLWHSDKPLVQLECASRIAKLILTPQTNSGKILLFSCIMRVLAREWRTMDRYRSDKYLALVRKLIFELACFLKSLENETKLKQEEEQNQTVSNPTTTTTTTITRKSSNSKKSLNTDINSANNIQNNTINNNNNNNNNNDNIIIIDHSLLLHDPLSRALNEACYVFQEQSVPEPSAVGLAMHICDVFFDEICRASLSPLLFVALSDRIALYAMSQGNYVEKRVLDYFISPIASGVLERRRREQYQQQHEQHEQKQKTLSAISGRKRSHSNNNNEEENNNNNNNNKADAETHAIIIALANACKRYAVARKTLYNVRVMLTESELALRQAANPNYYQELTRGAIRRRIEREITEVDETRQAVIEERRKMRMLRVQEKRQTLRGRNNNKYDNNDNDNYNDDNDYDDGEEYNKMNRKKSLKKKSIKKKSMKSKTDNNDNKDMKKKKKTSNIKTSKKEINNKVGNDKLGVVEMKKKKKPLPRNTKRKKHYTLTKKDLYGDE